MVNEDLPNQDVLRNLVAPIIIWQDDWISNKNNQEKIHGGPLRENPRLAVKLLAFNGHWTPRCFVFFLAEVGRQQNFRTSGSNDSHLAVRRTLKKKEFERLIFPIKYVIPKKFKSLAIGQVRLPPLKKMKVFLGGFPWSGESTRISDPWGSPKSPKQAIWAKLDHNFPTRWGPSCQVQPCCFQGSGSKHLHGFGCLGCWFP